MKRLLYILFLLPLGLSAQNMYNVSSLLDKELIGTARFVGMGGSMSSLGADLSTMGTNPAGMAMYRSSDFT
ncbi:MAG: TonB-dependent receptor, partial [Bacteroidaceae bacterium]|nr:TonB-dependent receptor [Bacteroidaceae bacterium]